MRSILSELTDVENSALLRDVSARLRDAIMAEKMPQDLQDAIGAAYVDLGKRVGEENPYVAVRSSATAEDLPDASFAGQQDTYLNVQGAETIIAKVKECYASCFTDRAVYYREKQGFDHIEVALSAVVQMMVFSKTSGVMFTVNVATGDDNNILIEAAFGLGEYVVQGTVTPDNYTISKHDHKIIDRCVNEQDIMLVRKKGGDCEEVQVPEELRKVQTLTDEQILELADYAKKIEKHYGCYMDMEWGVDERTNKIWILQARPETVWSRRNKEGGAKVQESKSMTTTDHKVIVKGLPASPGKVSGRVHVILDPSRIDEFKEGEILVTEMTAPDWVPAMKKAKAIVTDSGGMTCHASIVSRELGIPCIVGTKSRGEAATVTIPDGIDVTIDATHGVVYEGIIEEAKKLKNDQVKLHEIIDVRHQVNNLDRDIVKEREMQNTDNSNLEVGDDVYITSYDQYGTISRILKDNQYEVSIGNMSVKLAKKELTKVKTITNQQPKEINFSFRKSKATISMTLDLRGKRYEDAKEALDKYIDDLVVVGLKQATIIHGYGTGVIRELVQNFLKNNKNIASYRYGGENEGGFGVTVITVSYTHLTLPTT